MTTDLVVEDEMIGMVVDASRFGPVTVLEGPGRPPVSFLGDDPEHDPRFPEYRGREDRWYRTHRPGGQRWVHEVELAGRPARPVTAERVDLLNRVGVINAAQAAAIRPE